MDPVLVRLFSKHSVHIRTFPLRWATGELEKMQKRTIKTARNTIFLLEILDGNKHS